MAGYEYTMPQGSGWGYNGVDPTKSPTKVKNVLSDEEINKLFQKDNQFSLAITENERLRAICTHRFANGVDALQDLGDGTQRCQICGHEFMPINVMTSKEDIKASVDAVKDILQTSKLIYLDMPANAAREFFVLIALLDKIPEFFERACKDYLRHEKFMPYGVYGNRTANIISIYNMITGGAGPESYMSYDEQGRPVNPGFDPNSAWAYGNPVYGNPAWGNPMANGQASFYGQPYGAQQPYGFGASNGFVGQPMPDPNMPMNPPYQPSTQGWKFDPTTGQPLEGAATDPNSNAPVTEVKSTFKA